MARITRNSAARAAVERAQQEPDREPVQLSSPPATPRPRRSSLRTTANVEPLPPNLSPPKPQPVTPANTQKQTRSAATKEEDKELSHNLGFITNLAPLKTLSSQAPPAKRSRQRKSGSGTEIAQALQVNVAATPATSPNKSTKKSAKKPQYTPGVDPYPKWPHPTPEECEEVARLLLTVHPVVKQPETIPPPSLTISGCGEVPSVLDALLRTVLSAATTSSNSGRALQGLVDRFGVLDVGIGKGTVNWDKVRLADTKDIFEAIKCGGLGAQKSKTIHKILQAVWEEDQARQGGLSDSSAAPGAKMEDPMEMEPDALSPEAKFVGALDHLHSMSSEEAMRALLKYDGIGVKTASCVVLFCLRRPSFAVDTHVFRFCQWLGWVPPPNDPALRAPGAKGKATKPTPVTTFAHCEATIPDHLKYPLHKLFIKHGKTCPRCRAITGENSEGWDKGCVIDHLVKRTGARKGSGLSVVKVKKAPKTKGKRKLAEVDSDSDSDLSEPLEMDSEDEE